MTRKKLYIDNKQTRLIGLRVTEGYYQKLKKWLSQSNCHSITELVRSILYKQPVIWYHKNAELESTALELAAIRSELNAMGRNINQITKAFHTAETSNKKMFHALKVADEYKKVGVKVDRLLDRVSEISKAWLQK